MAVTLPFTFTPDTVADATQVNANFNTVVSALSGTVPVSSFAVSGNAAATLPAPPAGRSFLLRIAGADNTVAGLLLDGWVGGPVIAMRVAEGTAALPTATLLNDVLGSVEYSGRGTTGYGAHPACEIVAQAIENWTDTAQGSLLFFSTNQIGTTTPTPRLQIRQGLVVGLPTGGANGDMGPGTINCTGLYVNGVAVTVP